ncbi:MAG: trigger factor [Desulfobacterales bacterium]|nr:trigger factor [Desulfobacterales bacterium]
MQVSLEDVSSVKKILHIELSADKIKQELDSAYNDLKKTAKVKGFRPGKAPRGVLERLYGKDVHSDVSAKLIQTSFMDALKQSDLNIIGTPEIDPPELDPSGPYKYDAVVDVHPEIADIDFKGLTLKKTNYTVDDESVERQLKMLQKNMAQLKPIETARPAQTGDFLLIDYEGFQDGKPFSETQKTENFTMELGKNIIAKEIDDQIPGMNAGESKEIRVTFPDDHANEKLAGQTVDFQVTLNEIREELLPAIDDELAKKLGPFESLENLKQTIRDNLNQGYEKRTEQELNEQIFTSLIEKSSFEVPAPLIEYELDHIISDTERSFAQRNLTLEEVGLSRDMMAKTYHDVAEKQARRHMILSKIVSQEKLTVAEDETDNGIREMADAYQQPFEELKKFFVSQPDRLSFFKETLLEKKAIQLIIDNNEVETVAPDETAETDTP